MNPIEHPLGHLDLPSKIPDDRLKELIRKIKDGSATEAEYEEVALGHIRLAFSIAVPYAVTSPQLGEELVNEAVFGLAIALASVKDKLKDEEFTPYCITWMSGCVKTHLYKSSMVPIPYSTLKRRERQGANLIAPGYTNDLSLVTDKYSELDKVREAIQEAIQTEFEREVIARRELGFNDREIADQLNCCRTNVNDAKLAVWQRFREQS